MSATEIWEIFKSGKLTHNCPVVTYIFKTKPDCMTPPNHPPPFATKSNKVILYHNDPTTIY